MTPVLLLAFATFAGNEACKFCHRDIVRAYEATPMGRTTAVVRNNVPAGRFRHEASGSEYSISKDGRVRIRKGNSVKHEQFDIAIGSGSAGFSYLILRDRFLFQAPLTWYSQKNRWDAAPGYQDDPVMAWDRPIDPSCLLCHASQLTHIYGTVNRYADPPFRQAGVSCERCHGPGSDHAGNPAAKRMVIPTKLPAELRDDVCRQCHLLGEARIARAGRAFGEFRAGERLGNYVAYFVYDDPDGPSLRTTSHVEKLNASRCKQVSGERMWCGSCHNVHAPPAEPIRWYREKCEACHPANARMCKRGLNCVSCHMPKSRALDAGHGAFTDHRIGRRPSIGAVRSVKPWRLRPFSPADAGDRELALAYAQAYQRTRDERQKSEALRLATESLR
jgi:hypothetical protein